MLDKDLEKAVMQAKKTLSEEEIKDALEKCSYGGKPIDMSMKGGVNFGEPYTRTISKDK